jgi:hypothetical protein
MKIWLITLGPLFAIFRASVAQAQDTVAVGKITCEQFTTSQIIDSRTLSVWLSGYYNGTQKNTVIHPSAVQKSMEKLSMRPSTLVIRLSRGRRALSG